LQILFGRIKEFARKSEYLGKIDRCDSREEIENLNKEYNLTIDRCKGRFDVKPSFNFPHSSSQIGQIELGEGENSVTRILNDTCGYTITDALRKYNTSQNTDDEAGWFRPDWGTPLLDNLKSLLHEYKQKRTAYEAELITFSSRAETAEEALEQYSILDKDVIGWTHAGGNSIWAVKKKKLTDDDEVIQALVVTMETIIYIRDQENQENPFEFFLRFN